MTPQQAVERFMTAGTIYTMSGMFSVPKDPVLQKHLIDKVETHTGQKLTIEQIVEALTRLGFEPKISDADSTTYAREA